VGYYIMSTTAFEAAMADMETARVTFEATASRVSDELERLQERVVVANGKAGGERLYIHEGKRKSRRRRSGGAAAGAAQGENPDAAAEAVFHDMICSTMFLDMDGNALLATHCVSGRRQPQQLLPAALTPARTPAACCTETS
jgi:hypothetical protein